MGRRRTNQAAKETSGISSWAALPAILLFTAVVFWPALRFEFVFDDRVQIASNPSIYSWSYTPDYFRGQIWGFAHVWTSYYRPFFLLTLRIWHSVVSLDTVGWHALPISVHLLNIFLAFLLARKLTGDVVTSLTACALFAVHPAQLESVACLYGVTDPLMATLLIGAFLCYLNSRDRKNWSWFAATLLLFAAALLMKESAIVFPLVLASYEFSISREDEGAKRRSSIALPSLLGVAAMYLVIRRIALGMTFGAVAANVPWLTVIYTAPSTIVRFLRLLFAPYGMSSFYDSPHVNTPGIGFILPLLILVMVGAGIWLWSRRTTRLVSFCAIWALLAILPVLNIRVMQEGDFIHIRFLYIPCLALALLVAIGVKQILQSAPLRISAAIVLFAALAITTRSQIWYFANSETLYRRGIDVAPDNRVPKNNLADAYIKQGRDDEAQVLLEDVLRRHPGFWMANYNMGFLAYKHGDWPKASDYMERSIANGGEEVDAFVYRGYALLKAGRAAEAEATVREGISRRPNARSYHFVLGLVLRQEKRWAEALEAFQKELEINPQDHGAAQHVADLTVRLERERSPVTSE